MTAPMSPERRGEIDPFESLYRLMVRDSRDWALVGADAWMYGMIVGWDDDDPELDATDEAASFHDWGADQAARIRELRRQWVAARSLHQLAEPSDAVVEAMARTLIDPPPTDEQWARSPGDRKILCDIARAALAAGVAAALAPRDGAAGTRDTGTSEGGEGL